MSKKSKYRYEGYGVVRDTEIDFPYHTDDIVDLLEEKDQRIKEVEEENQRLKISQKELAISELEKVEDILWSSQDIGNLIDNDKFLEKLNRIIESLKGEHNGL